MKKIMLILCMAMCFTACTNGRSSNVRMSPKGGYSFSDYDKARKSPDHLRTPEQRVMLIELGNIIADYTVVEHNKLVFKMNEKAFTRKHMPKELYAEIQQNIEANNTYLASLDSSEVDLDKMLKNFKASMKNLNPSGK